eukprot:scaffold1248_cov104-Skeletonema_marinoi.AAC.7
MLANVSFIFARRVVRLNNAKLVRPGYVPTSDGIWNTHRMIEIEHEKRDRVNHCYKIGIGCAYSNINMLLWLGHCHVNSNSNFAMHGGRQAPRTHQLSTTEIDYALVG